jgi:hypothetical protein
MGRPVKKKYFGLVGPGTTITVNCKVGSNSTVETGIILAQRSSQKFKVNDAADGTGNTGVCTLVDALAPALTANQMSIIGYGNSSGAAITIKRLYNRTAHDFQGNRYTWAVVDDSTVTYLQLTKI